MPQSAGQDHRPDKKVYEITEAGREALRQWVTEPTPTASVRDEFVLKAYSLWLAEPGETITHFSEQERLHQQQRLRRGNGTY